MKFENDAIAIKGLGINSLEFDQDYETIDFKREAEKLWKFLEINVPIGTIKELCKLIPDEFKERKMDISSETPSDELIEIMLDENWAFDLREKAREFLKEKIKKLVDDNQTLNEKIKQLARSEQWK